MAETAIAAALAAAVNRAALARAGVGLSGRRERQREILDDNDTNVGEEAAMDEAVELHAGNDPVVEHLRQLFRSVVAEMQELRHLSGASELQRECSIAITQAETAEMWAVKAATWRYRR